jgi:hypothetical protein
MADTEQTAARAETGALLNAAGIVPTDEGRAQIRAQLAALDAEWTPERWEQARREQRDRRTAA